MFDTVQNGTISGQNKLQLTNEITSPLKLKANILGFHLNLWFETKGSIGDQD